jgi:hypothetical protein
VAQARAVARLMIALERGRIVITVEPKTLAVAASFGLGWLLVKRTRLGKII